MKLLSWLRRKSSQPLPESQLPERNLSYKCSVIQGIGTRERQEDAWALINADDVSMIRKEGLLAVVSDGMGGMANGVQASQTAIQAITGDFKKMNRSTSLEKQLTESVKHASCAVYEKLLGSGGSTVVACIVYDQQLYYAGMGDSYLFLLRQGKLIRINREHNVLHQRYLEMIRQGDMDIAGIAGIHQPNAVTDFLGLNGGGDVDRLVRPMPLLNEDVLLLCSDGIGGVLLPSEICTCIGQEDVNSAASALQKMLLAKKCSNQDNYTAVIIRCQK